jgi:hypothetical protein
VTSNDFSVIPPFLLQRADPDYTPAGAAEKDDISAPDRGGDIFEAQHGLIPPGEFDLDDVVTGSRQATTDAELGAHAGRIELSHPAVAPTPVAPVIKIASPAALEDADIAQGSYSPRDLWLFRTLTGYRLDMRKPIWHAVDDEGRRAAIKDRLFTTLAEEAFRLADRRRRSDAGSPGTTAYEDLTIDDLVQVLPSIRRAAASVGLRGASALQRLEQAILSANNRAGDEILAMMMTDTVPTARSSSTPR